MACIFGHKWNGCTCTRCGKARDSEHEWTRKDRECREVCANCGKTREVEHEWNGCICTRCGKIREAEHEWMRMDKECREVCAKCGRQRGTSHYYVQHRCINCGRIQRVTSQEAPIVIGMLTGRVQMLLKENGGSFSPCASECTRYALSIKTIMNSECFEGRCHPTLESFLHAYAPLERDYSMLTSLGAHALYATCAVYGTSEELRDYIDRKPDAEESKREMIRLMSKFYQDYVVSGTGAKMTDGEFLCAPGDCPEEFV